MTCLATSLPKSFHFDETTYRCLSKLAYLQIDDVAISEQHMILTQIFNYYVNELQLDSFELVQSSRSKKIINAAMGLHERLIFKGLSIWVWGDGSCNWRNFPKYRKKRPVVI